MIQSLDRLKVFYHVYLNKSVSKAAQVLNVSQSAISQALQKLEGEIKTPLFVRQYKRLIPTQAGEKLFGTVSPFMIELDSCLKAINRGKEYPSGELRVGAPREFGKRYLPPIIAGFLRQYPEVTFVLELGSPAELFTMLRDGQLDFALVDTFQYQAPPFADPGYFHFDSVFEEEIILVCSKEYYDLLVMGNHSPEHLAQLRYITYKQDRLNIVTWFKHHFGESSLKIEPVVTVDSFVAIISAIRHHVGMGIVSSHLVAEDIRKGEMIVIPTPKPAIRNQISLVRLQNKEPTLTEEVCQRYFLNGIELIGI